MKVEIFINGKETEIELTSAQIAQINKNSGNIISRIDSLQAALDYKGETMEQFNWRTERDTDQQRADKEWEVICFALREGKDLEMGAKWFHPYLRKSGSGFSYGYYYVIDYSGVGARHSVDTAEKAIYAGKKFISILIRRFSPNTK